MLLLCLCVLSCGISLLSLVRLLSSVLSLCVFFLACNFSSFYLVEGLSSVLSLYFLFYIASISWVTLLLFKIPSFSDGFVGFFGFFGFSFFCKGVVSYYGKTYWFFLWSQNRKKLWSSSTTDKCWFIIFSLRVNFNWSRWIIRHC